MAFYCASKKEKAFSIYGEGFFFGDLRHDFFSVLQTVDIKRTKADKTQVENSGRFFSLHELINLKQSAKTCEIVFI